MAYADGLSPAERLQVAVDTLRGLQADQERAIILAPHDEYQAQRVEVLGKQIESAEKRIKEIQPQVEAEAEEARREALRMTNPAMGPPQPVSERTDEFYEVQTREALLEWGEARGLDIKKSWNKGQIIKAHRERDTEETG